MKKQMVMIFISMIGILTLSGCGSNIEDAKELMGSENVKAFENWGMCEDKIYWSDEEVELRNGQKIEFVKAECFLLDREKIKLAWSDRREAILNEWNLKEQKGLQREIDNGTTRENEFKRKISKIKSEREKNIDNIEKEYWKEYWRKSASNYSLIFRMGEDGLLEDVKVTIKANQPSSNGPLTFRTKANHNFYDKDIDFGDLDEKSLGRRILKWMYNPKVDNKYGRVHYYL